VVIPPNRQSGQTADSYRFDAFEVRVKAGLLLHQGTRVRIQELPLRMLILLVQHSGEVVSRDQLRNHLWGSRTFVEFDSNLRVAAAKLREALGDNATQPRFLETVARRGYRFIGDAVPIIEAADPPQSSPAEPPAVAPAAVAPPATSLPSTVESPRRHFRPLIAWVLGATALLATLGVRIFLQPPEPLIQQQDAVALGHFLNHTDDRSLDEVLSPPFRVKMDESPYLRLVSNEQFARALLKSPDDSLSGELEACRELHARVLLNGQVTRADAGFDLELDAYDCTRTKRIATVTARADSQDDLLPALGRACEKMRLRLGESRTTLDRFDVPLVQATTSSLAALRAYRLGEQRHISGNDTESKTYYKLAIDLDPQFALAYLQMGRAYSNTGEPSSSRGYYQHAFDLRERTTERERLYITTSYYSYATGERLRAIEAYQLWSTLYPQDVIPANNLAGQYLAMGRSSEALASARRAIQIDPSLPQPYSALATALLKSGDASALKALCDDSAHRDTAMPAYHLACYEAAFERRDTLSMEREMTWARGKPQESALINAAAGIAFYQGRLSESRRLFDLARQSALANNLPEFATQMALDQAAMEAALGLTTVATQDVLDAVAVGAHGPEEEISVAFIWALLGNPDRADEAVRTANTESPLDTLLNLAQAPEIRAIIHLGRNNPEEAIRELEQVRPYDLCGELNLAPGYYRGLAYLRSGLPKRAVAEFQAVLSQRGAAPHSLYIPLSRLQLVKILSPTGENDVALALTKELEEIWRQADSGFPPLRELLLTTKIHRKEGRGLW
jgi:DNA-binding winged helix-turn-helix (wHTH) protein/tetratricopeptide (TPR) repeat protein